jgi:hypothetical protein
VKKGGKLKKKSPKNKKKAKTFYGGRVAMLKGWKAICAPKS